MRLRTSRRRRTKSPSVVTVPVASRLDLFMQPNKAFTLQNVGLPGMLFSFIVQCHKVSCDIYFDGLFRHIDLYIFTSHTTVTKNRESLSGTEVECNERSMTNSCFKRLRQHRKERLSIVASLARSTIKRS